MAAGTPDSKQIEYLLKTGQIDDRLFWKVS
jgi:hypothetical protein